MTTLIAFVFGAIVGSFLNVVGLRFLRDESIVWPGSHCYSCSKPIKPYDNIPVLSWVILRGKCRSCDAPISWQYPAIEALTGLLFATTIATFGFSWQAVFLIYLFCNLVVILITDFREQYIFDINSIGLIPFGLIFTFFNLNQVPGELVLESLGLTLPRIFISAILAVGGSFILFGALNLLSVLLIGKRGFGEGDTRLLMGIGAFFGIKLMFMIFALSFLMQAVIGIPFLIVQWLRQKAFKVVGFMLGGTLCALIPYVVQPFVGHVYLLLGIAVLCGIGAIGCALKSLSLAKELPTGLTYLPFGPAICGACVLLVFFQAPLVQLFNQLLGT